VLTEPEYSYVKARVYVLYALSAVVRRRLGGLVGVSCADLGCGFLPTPLIFSGVCSSVYAYDADGVSLEAYTLLSRGLNVISVEADIEGVEVFGDGRLGVVLALSVLEHLKNPLKVVRNVAKSMVRGGVSRSPSLSLSPYAVGRLRRIQHTSSWLVWMGGLSSSSPPDSRTCRACLDMSS